VARCTPAPSSGVACCAGTWPSPGARRSCVVFIDEIERLDREQQGRWLAEIRRIAQRRPGAVARVLATASPLLHEEVASRRFHPELWSALSRFQLQVLPLRDRLGYLESLARDLLLDTAPPGRPHLALSAGALAELGSAAGPATCASCATCSSRPSPSRRASASASRPCATPSKK
jgi:transcriptional regulator of acetoin/glycerol metabolism